MNRTVRWLPFTFERIEKGNVLLSNFAGELEIVTAIEFEQLAAKRIIDFDLFDRLTAKQFIEFDDNSAAKELLAIKYKTRLAPASENPGLHIFVVTLRCEHSCPYCQVSRTLSSGTQFDMSIETAMLALKLVFQSKSKALKIEFQGGESLLNFDLIKMVVLEATRINRVEQRNLAFVVATNLVPLDEEMLQFFSANNVHLSTSIDGPSALHNANRPRKGNDSFERAVDGIARARSFLGHDSVSALMTTTAKSLNHANEIVDTYVDLGFRSIFIRALSPFGFAIKKKQYDTYGTEAWAKFYLECLGRVIEHNRNGIRIREEFAALLLKRIFTNGNGSFADYQTPAGLGTKSILYNYDGAVYASDESRMLAETGDKQFKIGTVSDSLLELLGSQVLYDAIDESTLESNIGCSDCPFRVTCAADPVQQWSLFGDYVGKKAESPICIKTKIITKAILDYLETDDFVRSLFLGWAYE